MANENFRFEGGRELEAALRDLPGTTAKASARRMLRAAGAIIAKAAAANAPVRDGDLRDSYGVDTRRNRRSRRMSKGADRADVEVFVGPGQGGYQAGLQTEFGNQHQAAEPHLRPAFDAKVREVLDFIAREWWADIEKTVKRRARRLAKRGR